VHPSEDINKESSPNGYVFFGKLWDKEYLCDLDKITNCNIEVYTQKKILGAPSNSSAEFFLRDYKSRRIALLAITKDNPLLDDLRELNLYLNLFFIIFCLMIFVISYRTYSTLVVGPLTRIATSLNTKKAHRLMDLANKNNEFGKIARLIIRFFNQQEELKQNVEELNAAQESMSNLNNELSKQKFEIEEQNLKLQSLYQDLQSQNKEIQTFAEETSRSHKEITDSMKYASFIQNAVLAPSHTLSIVFHEHFIYYKPKSIVSGDFYYFREMKNGSSILAVADCTGHGLSGALLSMLGVSFLKEITSQLEDEEFDAATILNYLRIHLIESLHQNDKAEVQDGMNIALCIFDKTQRKLQYAAAFSSIFILRNDTQTGETELFEHEGNRAPVGIYRTNDNFTNYFVDLQKNDVIYLFSDGVIDQFGGATNKKYRLANFRKLLLAISHLPLNRQKEKLVMEYEDWKGPNEQTDDVLVLGVRVK
jgi:serine phosphatase RsbU (regulator of sigma subunit)